MICTYRLLAVHRVTGEQVYLTAEAHIDQVVREICEDIAACSSLKVVNFERVKEDTSSNTSEEKK